MLELVSLALCVAWGERVMMMMMVAACGGHGLLLVFAE